MRPLELLLIQHSANSDNLGVGALTASQLAILREAAVMARRDLRFTIAGWKDPKIPYINGDDIRICEVDRSEILSREGMWKRTSSADLVLDIGGGDSFSDIYGGKRLLLNLILKEIAFRNRIPLIISPQTIGPFSKKWAKFGALRAMRNATMVCSRDELSTKYLRQLGYRGEVIEATDVAMRLPYDPPLERSGKGPVRVGLNVSGLLMNGGYAGDNMFGLKTDYPKLIRGLIADFSERENVVIELISHVISDAQSLEDDYRCAQYLSVEFPGTILAPRFESPSAAKSYIAGLDFFTGARMHACIAAMSTGVPVIPIAYSRKFAGLFGTLGYDHTADCRSLNTKEVLQKVITGFERRSSLRKDALRAHRKALARLKPYEAALSKLMEAI